MQPIIAAAVAALQRNIALQKRLAGTAEELMRSRYTAYVLGDREHLWGSSATAVYAEELSRAGAQALDESPKLFDLLRVQSARFDLRDVLDLQQVFHVTECLHSTAEKDRDAIAHILHIRQQVRAENDGLALVLERDDQILHLAGTNRIEAGCRFI